MAYYGGTQCVDCGGKKSRYGHRCRRCAAKKGRVADPTQDEIEAMKKQIKEENERAVQE